MVAVSRPGFPVRFRPARPKRVRPWQLLPVRDPLDVAREAVRNAEIDFARAENLHERIMRKAEEHDATTLKMTVHDYRTAGKRARKLAASRARLEHARSALVKATKERP
jgi:hypothetical protein